MRTLDLGLSEVGSRSAEQWKRLSDIAVAPNPFADPRFLLTSAHTHDHARRGRVLLVEEGSGTIGALSYTPAVRKIGPLQLRSVSTSESFSAFEGERFHPLVAAGRAEEVFTEFFDAAGSRGAHILELARLPLDGHLDAALLSAARARGLPVLVEQEREFVCIRTESLSPEADSGSLLALGHVSPPSRKKIRRLARKLEQEYGKLELIKESSEPGAIDRFLALQNSGWKGDAAQDGKAFERTGLDAWFRSVTDAFRRDGRLSVLSLRAHNRTVFTTVVLHAGANAFGFHDAYAEEFTAYSPGRLGRLAEMKAMLTAEETALFDPSMDDDKYPQALSLYPDRCRYATLTVGLRGLGRSAMRHLPTARRVRARLRGEPG